MIHQLNEAPPSNKSLEGMSKTELQALAEQYGVKIDLNKNRGILIEQVEQIVNS